MSPISAVARTEWSRQLARALVAGGYLTDESVVPLLAQADAAGAPLGAVLVSRGLVQAPVVVTTLAQLARLPAIDLRTDVPSPDAAGLLPPVTARDHQAVPVRVVGTQAVVAFAEPPDPDDVRALGEQLGFEVVPVLGDPLAIEGLLAAGNGTSPSATGTAALGSRPAGMAAPGTTRREEPPAPAGGEEVELRLHVDDLLRYAVGIGASDLHLTAGMPPTVRLHGALRPMEDVERLDHETLRDMVFGILPQTLRERFEADHELDTSHSIAGVGRFRVNVCLQRGTIAVAMRPIPHEIPDFPTLGLPESVRTFTELRRGLVLVTGPTGSGKTTTLATMIDYINRTRACHIVTIEDPIEYLHRDNVASVDQREVGFDTDTFASAMRVVLRQDPDVILVGEMRDVETAAAALTAAETGHLVLSTLHTIDATETINRVVDFFPPHQQHQIRVSLAGALKGTIAQRLVRRADGSGRLPALEIMVANGRIRQCIVDPEITGEIAQIVAEGEYYGMRTFDQSLADLMQEGSITLQEALQMSSNPHDLRIMLEQRGLISTGGRW